MDIFGLQPYRCARRVSGRKLSVSNGVNAGFVLELLEQNGEWAVTRRYMTLETVAAICEDSRRYITKSGSNLG